MTFNKLSCEPTLVPTVLPGRIGLPEQITSL